MKRHDPILVTGSHRSGTTWVGRVLIQAARMRLLHEPFNLTMVSRGRDFDPGLWYLAIDEANAATWRGPVARTLTGLNYHRDLSLEPATLKGLATRAHSAAAFTVRRLRGDRIIYKDPLAFFSAEWLHREFGMTPVVMVRHPAAFASSLQLKNWRFDFTNFTRQPRLLEGRLAPWREQIERAAQEPPEMIDHAILLWNCIYAVAADYRDAHPDWIFRTHEELSLDPVGEFQELFEALGLDYGPAQRRFVEEVSGPQNPTEQTADEYRRNSIENIENWKRRLTTEKIDRVLSGTETVRAKFYAA